MLFFRTFILTPRYLKISPWWKFVQELIQTRAVFANCHISLFTDLLIRKGRKSNWRCSKLRFVKDRYVLASTFGRRKAFWRVIYSATGSSANPIKNNTQSNRYSIFTLCSVRSVFYHKYCGFFYLLQRWSIWKSYMRFLAFILGTAQPKSFEALGSDWEGDM